MSEQDPDELYKRPVAERVVEDVVEVRPPRRQIPLWSLQGIGSCAAFAVIEEIKPAWTVPPCDDSMLFRKRLEESMPGIRQAIAPVPGEVVQ